MPISVRLCVRSKTTTLQVRFFVDGQPDGGFSRLKDGTVFRTDDLPWNQKKQCFDGKSAEAARANGKIAGLKADLHAVYDRQRAVGITPTCQTVKAEYFSGIPIEKASPEITGEWTVLGCYRAYIKHIDATQPHADLKQSTLDKWGYGLNYLEKFLRHTKEELKTLASVSIPWAKKFHLWLMGEGPMAADSATRYVNKLSNAIDHLVEGGEFPNNPLANMKMPRGKTKEVYFLDPEHLEKFWQLELVEDAAVACWWMGVIFLTGMDYVDAVRYVHNRKQFEKVTKSGKKKIVINRSKPPRAECHIPMLPELEALLLHYPGVTPKDWEINREMYAVQTLIGFGKRLTTKIGRKTAGAIFLLRGYRLEAVSRILGHSSVSVTERYYVKITGHIVDGDMDRLDK